MTVVAVTGGGRGIGQAIAKRLAADGMHVAIGDVDEGAALAAADGITGAIGLHLDVADPESFDKFLDAAESTFGPIDILINNAGIMPIGPFLEQDAALRRRTVDINVHGPLNGMAAVLPRMCARGTGTVVNIASTAGVAGVPGGAVYSATKHAVVGMADALRQEFAAAGITVCTVLPTFTNTELISGTNGLRGVRTMEPADVAEAVATAIKRKRPVTFVPRHLQTLSKVNSLLPKAIADVLAKAFGADTAFLDIDHSKRAEYDKRIGS